MKIPRGQHTESGELRRCPSPKLQRTSEYHSSCAKSWKDPHLPWLGQPGWHHQQRSHPGYSRQRLTPFKSPWTSFLIKCPWKPARACHWWPGKRTGSLCLVSMDLLCLPCAIHVPSQSAWHTQAVRGWSMSRTKLTGLSRRWLVVEWEINKNESLLWYSLRLVLRKLWEKPYHMVIRKVCHPPSDPH